MAVSFNDKINNISKNIMKEAEAKRDEIIKSALDWAADYEKKEIEKIEDNISKKLNQIKKDSENSGNRNILQATLEQKKNKMKKISELVENLFEEVNADLKTIRENKKYPAILRAMIIEAVMEIDEPDIILIFDKRDECILTPEFLEKINNYFFTEHNKIVNLIKSYDYITTNAGVMVKPENKNYFLSNTVEERLNSSKTELKFIILKELYE
ncbi:V-type ATP synthase subunit E [Candidatus Dependentiae bacterium]|nr:V-type ATP synthase subunit E [Candidatus Dependentiae bacterium]